MTDKFGLLLQIIGSFSKDVLLVISVLNVLSFFMADKFGLIQIIGSFSKDVLLVIRELNVLSFSFSLAEDISNCGQLKDLSLCNFLGLALA